MFHEVSMKSYKRTVHPMLTMKTYISNIVCTTPFWINYHQAKIGKPNTLKSLGASKPKGLNNIAKGHKQHSQRA